MANFLKSNGSEKPRRKGHFDEYREALKQLDDETKKKLELQRTLGMAAIVLVAVGLFCVLVFTGIGVDKTKSRTGNYFVDLESVVIECFGDSLTEGYTVSEAGIGITSETTYPSELQKKLPELFQNDGRQYKCTDISVKNYGQSGSVLQETSYSRLSGTANIVVILYPVNNFIEGIEYEGTLEANISYILSSKGTVFLLNYPVLSGSRYADKLEQANNYISSTAKSMNVPFIDLNEYFKTKCDYSEEELFAEDGIHLTELGYTVMGDYIAEIMHDYYNNML